MIIEVIVCRPDGTQEVEQREVEKNPFDPPVSEPTEGEKQQMQLEALKVQLAQSDEAAISAFEAQAATDEAIIALYEKIGG